MKKLLPRLTKKQSIAKEYNKAFFEAKEWISMPENLEDDQINRLWEHRQHIDNEFYSLLNFFLIFESVLLGVVGVLYSRPNPVMLMLRIIIILGLSITIVWGYIQARHKYILNHLNVRAEEVLPEYRTTLDGIAKAKWPFSSTWLLTYVVPTMIALVWVILLFFLP